MNKDKCKLSPQGTHYYLTKEDIPTGSTIIVMVHGIGSCSALFEDLIIEFEEARFIVLAYDLIGRGKSSYPADGLFDGNAHVSQLRVLLQHLKLEENNLRLHFVCHSMGGAIGTLYACAYPHEIESMTLLAPAGLLNPGVIKFIRQLPVCLQSFLKNRGLRPNQEKAWKQDFIASTPEGKQVQSRCAEVLRQVNIDNPLAFEAFFQSILQFPLYGIDESAMKLSIFSFKVLLMWGTADKAVRFAPSYERWKNALQSHRTKFVDSDGKEAYTNIKTRVFDKLGHGFYLEVSRDVSREIIEFLH
jgi:pimeloyl-ACP methyl ester carboxylesterase